MAEVNPIFDEISALLRSSQLPAIDELEHTLTSGYAAALGLEAERWRLERKIADAAGRISREGGEEHQLADLAERLSAAGSDLTRLRGMLSALRERADAARAAA